MLSFQGNAELKVMFQKRFAGHRALDQVLQGTGFDNESQRGCFIGCTMNAYSHESFAEHIGPQWLAYLADQIFEGLPVSEAPQFGTDLLDAIPVGVDLENVKYALAVVRHKRQIERLKDNQESYAEECRQALQKVIDFCELEIKDESARSAARSAAESAAESARSAAESAWSAERTEYQHERDALLTILRALK
jgi:hypothetical protein